MSKNITFEGIFPRFDENGEFSTDLETNLIHRFYLDENELQDKYLGKTDEEILQIEQTAHEQMLASQAAVEAAAVAERQAEQ